MKKVLIGLAILVAFVVVVGTVTGCNADFTSSTNKQENNILVPNCKVTLQCNNGDIETVNVDKGDSLEDNYTPTKNGYLFKGWYTDSNCSNLYDFTRAVENDFTLYAGYVLARRTISLESTVIKAWLDTDSLASYTISFSQFDLNYLAKKGYGINVTATYEVKYEKDFQMVWDIGYAGPPRYEVTLLNKNLKGYEDKDLTTTESYRQRTFSRTFDVSFIQNDELTFTFSTDNIQNLIYFRNTEIEITAVRIR